MKHCLYCESIIKGRKDKKFCNPYCKSAYHNIKNQDKEDTLFKKIDTQLKKNRKILKGFNKAGFVTIRQEKLLKEGFDPKYFTHYWKNQKGQVYLFCYEYGFLELKEYTKKKYLLIIWQEYMNRS
ncbi:hypothetical protein [Aquimarina sp. 2201CG14-23]|uniref:hypothetical protein n=1 Tax=Aquimarina mycalae TaxID=3040073 RepID=UPI002477D995|nr:hypothetical protein [Aquimarina sp. 2201CG14-23]MDH7448310.1 hypothetical protein [Aquimarina sp. 2201CG14-23]